MEWLTTIEEDKKPDYKDPRRANLCGARLSKIYLVKVDLSWADLRSADLSNSNLSDANLHKAWLDQADLSLANLNRADLSQSFLYDASLRGASLARASLYQAKLHAVNLRFANLSHADLSHAELYQAQLNSASLDGANLTRADLNQADLRKASLEYADLTLANLQGADLREADLSNTILKDALLHYAKMYRTRYFPKYGALPDIVNLRLSEGFESMRYYHPILGAPTLVELRAAYRNIGMRDMERMLTYMIKSAEQRANWDKGGWLRLESSLNKLFFDWPSAYGMAAQRPLKILLLNCLIFAFVYWLGLRWPWFRTRIGVNWAARLPRKRHKQADDKIPMCYQLIHLRPYKRWQQGLWEEFRLIRVAFHLSLISAFHLGWREFNIGVWIGYLQSRSYRLQVRSGWMRSLSGLQSLLGLYLLALWAMTQFGRPFA